MDVCEREKEYEITAELPGMDTSNIDVKLANGVLTIKGEKKEEKEEKEKDYYLSERRFGSFQRSFQLPEGIDEDKIQASFEKGVLTIKFPKGPRRRSRKRRYPSARNRPVGRMPRSSLGGGGERGLSSVTHLSAVSHEARP